MVSGATRSAAVLSTTLPERPQQPANDSRHAPNTTHIEAVAHDQLMIQETSTSRQLPPLVHNKRLAKQITSTLHELDYDQ